MKYFLLIVCACLLLSCGDRVPAGIIPRQQMETILWQLMQTDEFTATAFTTDTTKNLNTERIRRYRQIFQLNQTTKEAFAKSYDYYMAHPEMIKPMFDSINARATRLRDTVAASAPFHPVTPVTISPSLQGRSIDSINKLRLIKTKLKPAGK